MWNCCIGVRVVNLIILTLLLAPGWLKCSVWLSHPILEPTLRRTRSRRGRLRQPKHVPKRQHSGPLRAPPSVSSWWQDYFFRLLPAKSKTIFSFLVAATCILAGVLTYLPSLSLKHIDECISHKASAFLAPSSGFLWVYRRLWWSLVPDQPARSDPGPRLQYFGCVGHWGSRLSLRGCWTKLAQDRGWIGLCVRRGLFGRAWC